MLLTEKKKRASAQKNKLEEIEKPRGFDRQLPLERILGATDLNGFLMFLLKWTGCDEYDLLPASEVNEKDPATVIAYYEERSSMTRKCDLRAKIQAQIDEDLINHPPADAAEIEEPSVDTEVASEVGNADLIAELSAENPAEIPVLEPDVSDVPMAEEAELTTVEEQPDTEAVATLSAEEPTDDVEASTDEPMTEDTELPVEEAI